MPNTLYNPKKPNENNLHMKFLYIFKAEAFFVFLKAAFATYILKTTIFESGHKKEKKISKLFFGTQIR